MNRALPERPGAPGGELRAPSPSRPARGRSPLLRNVLVQTLVAIAAPSALLAVGSITLAARLFYAVFGLMSLRLLALRRRDELLCLFFAVVPFAGLLRNEIFFNVILVVYGMGIFLWFALGRQSWLQFFRANPFVASLTIYFGLYYGLSLATTRQYDVNLRVFECVLGAMLILILGRRPELLRAGLWGLAASVLLLGVALLPHLDESERLGVIDIEGFHLGNPVQFGIPAALCLLATIADGGRWLGLRKPAGRLLAGVPFLALLLLTTSRTSWLIAAAGAAAQLIFGRRSRGPVLIAILAGVVVFRILLVSSAGESLDAGVERTFDEDRSARNRTSGRSDQWIVAWHAMTRTAGSLLFGYGAGSGPRVYAEESLAVSNVQFKVGREVALHSLFMQLGVEVGLFGLLPFLIWLAMAGIRILRWTVRTGLVFPMMGFAGYVVAAAASSGNDMVSGALLGAGLLATVTEMRTSRRTEAASLQRPPVPAA